jgi:hypothetical protein
MKTLWQPLFQTMALRRTAVYRVLKNLRERSPVDKDYLHGLFDTQAGSAAGLLILST